MPAVLYRIHGVLSLDDKPAELLYASGPAIDSPAAHYRADRSVVQPNAGLAWPVPGYAAPMAWLVLIGAAIFEIGWAVGLKYSAGFTRLGPSLWTVMALVLSVGLLAIAARTLPIGTAYAVWTGIGAAGTALLGIVLFQEPATAARLGCIALILLGVIGLRLVSAGT